MVWWFSKGLAGAHATGRPSPFASFKRPIVSRLVDVMLFGRDFQAVPEFQLPEQQQTEKPQVSALSLSSWLPSSLFFIVQCSVGYGGSDGGRITNGSFRCETRLTNWSDFCHSCCPVSGRRSSNEIRWGTLQSFVPTPTPTPKATILR